MSSCPYIHGKCENEETGGYDDFLLQEVNSPPPSSLTTIKRDRNVR